MKLTLLLFLIVFCTHSSNSFSAEAGSVIDLDAVNIPGFGRATVAPHPYPDEVYETIRTAEPKVLGWVVDDLSRSLLEEGEQPATAYQSTITGKYFEDMTADDMRYHLVYNVSYSVLYPAYVKGMSVDAYIAKLVFSNPIFTYEVYELI